MEFPRIGVGLPNYGPYASPDAILMVATAVEALGFHSVSTSERLLLPATPGWKNDFGLPEYPVYDAIETLTWVAAQDEPDQVGHRSFALALPATGGARAPAGHP